MEGRQKQPRVSERSDRNRRDYGPLNQSPAAGDRIMAPLQGAEILFNLIQGGTTFGRLPWLMSATAAR